MAIYAFSVFAELDQQIIIKQFFVIFFLLKHFLVSYVGRTGPVTRTRAERSLVRASDGSPFVVALSKSHLHSFRGNDQKLTSTKDEVSPNPFKDLHSKRDEWNYACS